MENRPLTWQELEQLRVLHVAVDEQRTRRVYSVADFTKLYHQYMQLLRRYSEYGSVPGAA